MSGFLVDERNAYHNTQKHTKMYTHYSLCGCCRKDPTIFLSLYIHHKDSRVIMWTLQKPLGLILFFFFLPSSVSFSLQFLFFTLCLSVSIKMDLSLVSLLVSHFLLMSFCVFPLLFLSHFIPI